MIAARTEGYTCAAKVWALCLVQGPFSVSVLNPTRPTRNKRSTVHWDTAPHCASLKQDLPSVHRACPHALLGVLYCIRLSPAAAPQLPSPNPNTLLRGCVRGGSIG